MIERFKSTLLFILMANSLVLSSILWYKQPGLLYTPTNISNGDLLKIGKSIKIEDLLQPNKIIFHLGNNQQTCALPESSVFQNVRKGIPKWNFYNYSVVQFTDEQWIEIMDKKKGMEIQFPLSIPVDILPSLFGAVGLSNYMKEVNRLWFYEDSEQKQTVALFLSDKERKIILARTTLSAGELNSYYFNSEKESNLPFYIPFQRITDNKGGKVYKEFYYLPQARQELANYKYFSLQITSQQAVNALFPDPGATRPLVNDEGVQFITDGIRSLTIPETLDSFVYSGSAPQGEGKGTYNVMNSLTEGVNFINAHGGFSGDYVLENMEDLVPPQQSQMNFLFRERMGSYFLYDTNSQGKQHIMNLQSNLGFITRYQRPLFNLDTYFEKDSCVIHSGPELLESLKGKQSIIISIDLGYQATWGKDYTKMVPVWVINYVGGGRDLIPASIQKDDKQEEK